MENANILIMLLSPNYLATDYIVNTEIPIASGYPDAAVRTKQVFWVLLEPCGYEAFDDIAKCPVYPLKEIGPGSSKATQLAITEYPNVSRQWVKLLKRILDEE